MDAVAAESQELRGDVVPFVEDLAEDMRGIEMEAHASFFAERGDLFNWVDDSCEGICPRDRDQGCAWSHCFGDRLGRDASMGVCRGHSTDAAQLFQASDGYDWGGLLDDRSDELVFSQRDGYIEVG